MALRALHWSKCSDFAQIPLERRRKVCVPSPGEQHYNTRAFTPEWEGRIFEFPRLSSLDVKASQGQLGEPRRLRPFDEQVSALRSIHGSRWQVLMVFMWRPTLIQNTPSISTKSDSTQGNTSKIRQVELLINICCWRANLILKHLGAPNNLCVSRGVLSNERISHHRDFSFIYGIKERQVGH